MSHLFTPIPGTVRPVARSPAASLGAGSPLLLASPARVATRSTINRRSVSCSAGAPCNADPSRRGIVRLLACSLAPLVAAGAAAPASAAEIAVVSETDGLGGHNLRQGDLALIHFVGYLENGDVFDSTRGGLKYVDGGAGVFRPLVVLLSPSPSPGICEGLKMGLKGLQAGSKRTFTVPPELGFGSEPILAPYKAVPGNATLRYEVEVLRVSSEGPDILMKGIAKCGKGGAGAQEDGCRDIVPSL